MGRGVGVLGCGLGVLAVCGIGLVNRFSASGCRRATARWLSRAFFFFFFFSVVWSVKAREAVREASAALDPRNAFGSI